MLYPSVYVTVKFWCWYSEDLWLRMADVAASLFRSLSCVRSFRPKFLSYASSLAYWHHIALSANLPTHLPVFDGLCAWLQESPVTSALLHILSATTRLPLVIGAASDSTFVCG